MKWGLYGVHVCALTPAHQARWVKESPIPTKSHELHYPWIEKGTHFLHMHQEFKFGSNFSLWDISCVAINIENSQKLAKTDYGSRKIDRVQVFVWPLSTFQRSRFSAWKDTRYNLDFVHFGRLWWSLSEVMTSCLQLTNLPWAFPSCQVLKWGSSRQHSSFSLTEFSLYMNVWVCSI